MAGLRWWIWALFAFADDHQEPPSPTSVLDHAALSRPAHAAARPGSLRRIAVMMRAVAANIGSRLAPAPPASSPTASKNRQRLGRHRAAFDQSADFGVGADVGRRASSSGQRLDHRAQRAASSGGASSGKPPAARVLAIRSARSASAIARLARARSGAPIVASRRLGLQGRGTVQDARLVGEM